MDSTDTTNIKLFEIKLIGEDNIKFHYIDKRQTTIMLYMIVIDMTNIKIALHNINLFCEKIKKFNKKIMYIQHYSDKSEYIKNKELYNKFHVKVTSETSICLTCDVDTFPSAFWKCLGWKD